MGDEAMASTSTSNAARRKEEKARKKDQRSWENVMKSMGDISDGEKLRTLKDKYTSLYNELRNVTSSYQAIEKKYIVVQREKEQAQSDLNKNILAKSKLEGLCRELQKQNKVIKDENITRIKEEEEKRREVATNFTERLNSLSSMMDENKDKSVRLREENMNMTIKLTELYNKFQERENHLADVNRQLDTQKDLFESKIKKMELEYKTDRNAWEDHSKTLLSNLLKSNETNHLLEENIKSMQANLDVYKNQYSDFEQTMSRSNEVFKTFHGEINKLQKSNTALEKEKYEYITKWKSCHNSVVEISEKNQQLVKKLEMSDKKLSTLEKLCRQLQTERTTLHKQLQDKNELHAEFQHDISRINSCDSSKQEIHKYLKYEKQNEMTNGVFKPAYNFRRQLSSEEDDYPPDDDEFVIHEDAIPSPRTPQSPLMIPQLSEMIEYSDVEMDAAGDGSMPQTSLVVSRSDISTASVEDLDGTVIELQEPTGSEIFIKEARSMPTTKREHQMIDNITEEEPQTSNDDLCGDLSLETLPLYKPHAVTDVPTQGGHASLVKESEARTNIRELSAEEERAGQTTQSEDNDSSGTINLKESEGKTDIKKE